MLTYAMRERDGLRSISSSQYPAIEMGYVHVGANLSVFDRIVWGGSFTLYQAGDEYIARSAYSEKGWPRDITGVRSDPLVAIEALAEVWRDPNGASKDLPVILL